MRTLSEPIPSTNVPEYAISELAQALRRTVEEAYGFVRVRGEVSKWFVSRQGHAYITLKDANAVLEAVCFKPRLQRISFKPEEGLEVVCTGRLSTYAQRSQYQLIVEDVRPHGVGALLAQLEARKRELAAEGLFAAERKRALPFLPDVVGVVTSPTGAVIRDILHRLADRFPRSVIVWPVTVQGERCAAEVAQAIEGFNRLPETGWPRRPDVLIVARGGGSIEDLWGFNDELVVRAAATSAIPLVAAVGHETDTTLIDLAADVRAPTPTAAAERIVPVAAEIRQLIARDAGRLDAALERVFEAAAQAVDRTGERLPRTVVRLLERGERQLRAASLRLRTPSDVLRERGLALTAAARQLERSHERMLEQNIQRLERCVAALPTAGERRLASLGSRLEAATVRLEALSYQRTLARGYALVRDAEDHLVGTAAEARTRSPLVVEFADGRVPVTAGDEPAKRRRRERKREPEQRSLL